MPRTDTRMSRRRQRRKGSLKAAAAQNRQHKGEMAYQKSAIAQLAELQRKTTKKCRKHETFFLPNIQACNTRPHQQSSIIH